mgnify:CR=1 FL=1
MKKILIFICLLSLVGYSYAQNNNSGLSISIKSGVTLANMYGSDVLTETSLNGGNPDNFYANSPASDAYKTGFNLGLLMDYKFGKHVSLGVGTSYIQKGAKINADTHWNSDLQAFEEVSGNIYWNQNYWTFEIPVTLYVPVKKNSIYLRGGLFAGFLVNSVEKGKIKIADQEYEYTNDRTANTTDPGYFLRAGYMYALPTRGNIFVEVAWSRSIKSVGGDLIPNPKHYFNQTVSINVGYRYNFKFSNK